ncbi:MAG: LssY C-terminal domain-containing protein, partial [Desulforhabdus sp.]|nr:LssY C-terminal domain-containing protein [Desulforhabdus sp.]
MILTRSRLLGVPYKPHPEERAFVERADVQRDEELAVSVSVLDDHESERFFGVRLARRGIQPVWLRIVNRGEQAYRLHLRSLDPNYYSPLEAAFVNHFAVARRLIELGLLAWIVFPLLAVFVPFKYFAVRTTNRRIDAYFQEHGIGWGLIRPGGELSGFAFTSLDEGKKEVTVELLGTGGSRQFFFSIPVAGLNVDHGKRRLEVLYPADERVDCDEGELRQKLKELPRCTTNKRGTAAGDPLNLVAIGDFSTVLNGFGARWDETETITPGSCWRTEKAYLLGASYRYSPISPLYVAGRRQDFALQKARRTINQRLHL